MNIFKKHITYILILSILILVLYSFISIKTEKTSLIVLGSILLLFAFLICYNIEKSIVVLTSKISGFLSNISKRDFNIEKIDKSHFDVHPKLYSSLKEFSEDLSKQFHDIENDRNQFKTILEAMSEGVIIISDKGNILLINNSAKKMFQLDEISESKTYWEVIRNKDLLDVIELSNKSKISINKVISTVHPEEKFYQVNIELLDSPSNVIIVVIFDITEFKKLDHIKADLIANVSHELRTPLTSMKGYIETLIDEAYDSSLEKNKFLEIINKNTDRLINIVSDLLILSEIEVKQPNQQILNKTKNDYEKINIEELILNTIVSLNSKISDKNIVETVDIQTNLPKYTGDKFLIEQLLTNLIDNAVKYTPENGHIKVKAFKNAENLIIEVSDSGIGIPKDHQERIFERFYRVDKNRSREIGGTGLGLSIVKHIVLQHLGNINVESEENVGSKFIIQLPYR